MSDLDERGINRVGTVAMKLMADLEAQLPADAVIGEVAVVAEVKFNADTAGTPTLGGPLAATDVVYECSDDRRWVQAGLLARAIKHAGG